MVLRALDPNVMSFYNYMKCAKLINTIAHVNKDRAQGFRRRDQFEKFGAVSPTAYPHVASATHLGKQMGTAQSAFTTDRKTWKPSVNRDLVMLVIGNGIITSLTGKEHCCNLSVGVALNVWFTTNGMYAKNNTTYMWREQATIEWLRRMIYIVACRHSAKLCAYAARFPIATKWCCDQDVKVVLCETFAERTCDRCGSS